MTYKEYLEIHPDELEYNIGYTEYLVSKFKSMTDYLSHEIPDKEMKLEFEGENSSLLEEIASKMEEFLFHIENR